MKNRLFKLICVLACACLVVVSLTFCVTSSKVAMKHDSKDGGEINQSLMSLLIAITNGERSEYAPYLNSVVTEGTETTYGDLIVVEATTLGEMLLKCEYLNDVIYGFGLSAEQKDSVKQYMDSVESAYGSKSEFSKELSKFGADKEALERFVTLSLKQSTLRQNLFGEGGINYITDDKLTSYFADKYIIADHVYIKLAGEVKEDGTSVPLTEEEKQAKRDLASSIYNQIQSGALDFDKAIEEYGEDTYKVMYPNGYFVPKDQNSNLEQRVLAELVKMNENDTSVVETESGIYILRKNEMKKELCLSIPEFAAALIYTIENEQFGAIIEKAGEVKIDKDIVDELDPSVIPAFSFASEQVAG